ncbi:MAG TPA: DHA2 family efflux MFS transporter permease subunit [Streptosporangiaceae bacterium]|jgi:EmrB/QacA subfamily drug resistance transporter|nr:DHA2 family efflux MFS transporter permease subunit [Streptosporangiaceae bacterium]
MDTESRGRPAASLLLTSVAFFMVALDALVVVTALPAIHAQLGGSMATLQWTVNAYGLAFAAGIITASSLGDRLGRRRVYVAGLILFSAASAACALAPTAATLIAARAVQGAGAAVVTPLSLTILTSSFPAARRGAVVGIWGGIAGLAVAGGPLVGGAVVQGLSWHWIFWVNVPIGLAAAIASARLLPDGRGPARRLDLPALPLIAGAALASAWGLVRAGGSGWGDRYAVALLAGGAALLAGFVVRERTAADPMVPPRLFRSRAFTAANAAAFLQSGAIFSAAFLTTQYFQLGLGYGPLAAGVRLLPWTATPMLVAPLAGAFADRIGTRPLLVTGLALQAGGLAWFAAVASAAGGYGRFVAPLIIAGVGASMSIPTVAAAALGAVPPAEVGTASGVNNTMQRFGGAFGVAIVTAVFTAHGSLGSAAGVVAGYRPALAVSAVLSLGGSAAAVAAGRRRTAPHAAPQAAAGKVPASAG